MRTARFGVDFDNTIVSYAGLFEQAVDDLGLSRPENIRSKDEVRTWLRSIPGGEEQWQRSQARVYGDLIRLAQAVAGFGKFVHTCRDRGWSVQVVSHKTEFSKQDQSVNLHVAATNWMEDHGFFDELGFSRTDIHFCTTRKEKLDKIRALECTLFVDDLIEVLLDPMFPDEVDRILMSSEEGPVTESSLTTVRSWLEVGDIVFE